MTTTTWDAPAWDHVAAASPGMSRLLCTLQVAAAASEAAVTTAPDTTPRFNPYAGCTAARGVLVGLVMAAGLTPPPELDPRQLMPPGAAAAAELVDRLYRAAADRLLEVGLELRAQLPTVDDPHRGDAAQLPLLVSLSLAMRELAAAYVETFGRPW